MHLRNFDAFFGDQQRTYDMSKLQQLDVNTTIDDGPAGSVTPGHLTGLEGAFGNPPIPGQPITVHLTAGVTYAFAERPADTGGIEDPFLLLYNPGGSLVSYDDDGGAGRSSLLTYKPSVTGDYTLVAGSWVNIFDVGGDSGDFHVYQWDNTTPDTPGTTAGAFHITTGTTFGMLDSNTDIDVYQIDLTGGLLYTFGYSGGSDGAGETGNRAKIELLDSNGNVVTSGNSAESGMSYFAQAGGSYYVRVTPNTATGTGKGGYTLDVGSVNPAEHDPLDAIRWKSANNIHATDTNGDGVGDTVYIYFAPAGVNYGQTEPSDNTTPMTTYGWQQNQIDAVMNAMTTSYSPITGLNYVQTNDESQAQLKLVTTINQVFGARFFPQDPAYGSQQGVGAFNLISGGFGADPNSLLQGGFSYAVILHEFGHAHGLAHTHDNGGGSDVMLGVTSSTGSYGIYNLNQGVYTVMSYNDGYPLDPDGQRVYSPATRDSGWSGSLSAFDIAVLQERYGEHAFNTGDNTYTIADDQAHAFYQCIWDTGGNDTIAYTGARDAQIDLLAATLDYSPTGGGVVSIAHGIFGGYTIANGVQIENATGGSGNDVLLGNAIANTLAGNDGNDTLMGRAGDDFLLGGAGNDTVYGGDGVDVATLGAGNDTFVAEVGATKLNLKGPQKGAMSMDIITDFGAGDHIDVSHLGAAFTFHGTDANKNADDLTFKTFTSVNGAESALGVDIDGHTGASGISGPVTVVYGNTDGGAADFAIVLLNHNGVSSSDFIYA
jgi:Ca2+-binding RTX toxin-like protein